MANEEGISLAAPALTGRKGPPSDGNKSPQRSPSPDGQKQPKTSKSRCKRCAESHLRCSIPQTGYPCNYCRRNKIQCTPSVMMRKGIKLGTKRGSYKKSNSNGKEGTRPETTSNSPEIVPAGTDFEGNESHPDLQKLKRNLENLDTILDGPPTHKRPRHNEGAPAPAALLELLTTSTSMHGFRAGTTVAVEGHNRVARTPLPSYRGQFTSSGGLPEVETTATNTSPPATQMDGSGYGRWTRLSTTDVDDDDGEYYDEDEDVFYDSSPFPALASPTSTSAGHQPRSVTEATSTNSASRVPSHLSLAENFSASVGTALPHENNEANTSPTRGPGEHRLRG